MKSLRLAPILFVIVAAKSLGWSLGFIAALVALKVLFT